MNSIIYTLTEYVPSARRWNATFSGGSAADAAWLDDPLWQRAGDMTLIADAPATPQPSAPVVACKAPTWCGQRLPDALMRGYEMGTVRTTKWTSIVHCSTACRDVEAKLACSNFDCAKASPHSGECALIIPPSKPAGWCCGASDCEAHLDTCPKVVAARAKSRPAEQPKPAAKAHDFSDPYCATKTISGRPMRMCVACGEFECDAVPGCEPQTNWRAFWEAELLAGNPSGILRDPAIPERLPRPRLAHSMNIEDPTLPEAR
jgi:hypothetical protein